jgi:hypothetical protein
LNSADSTGGTASFSDDDYDAVDAAYRLVDYSRLTATPAR